MGYCHHWQGFFDGDPATFTAIRADFEKLILPLADAGCFLAGPSGTGLPEITEDYIAFNGLRHCGHESVEGPVVVYPAETANGIATGTNKLMQAGFLAFTTSRRCDGHCCHDSFVLRKRPGMEFVKTAFKPYDLAVTAALLIAKRYWGEQIEIRTDGAEAQWSDAKRLCQAHLGYGDSFRIVSNDFWGPVLEERDSQAEKTPPHSEFVKLRNGRLAK